MVVSQQRQVTIRLPCPEPFNLLKAIWPQDILALQNLQKQRARRHSLRKLSVRHRRQKFQVAPRQMLQLRMKLDLFLPICGRFFIFVFFLSSIRLHVRLRNVGCKYKIHEFD
ncbi:hypothetical protein MRX96_049997 [Rhipicephalus microplus]